MSVTLEREVERLKTELESKSFICDMMTDKALLLNKKIASYEKQLIGPSSNSEEIEKLNDEIKQLRKEIETLNDEIEQLKQERDTLTTKVKEIEFSYIPTIDSQRDFIINKDAEIEALKKELSSIKVNTSTVLKEESEKLKDVIRDLEYSLADNERKLMVARKESKDLRDLLDKEIQYSASVKSQELDQKKIKPPEQKPSANGDDTSVLKVIKMGDANLKLSVSQKSNDSGTNWSSSDMPRNKVWYNFLPFKQAYQWRFVCEYLKVLFPGVNEVSRVSLQEPLSGFYLFTIIGVIGGSDLLSVEITKEFEDDVFVFRPHSYKGFVNHFDRLHVRDAFVYKIIDLVKDKFKANPARITMAEFESAYNRNEEKLLLKIKKVEGNY